MWELDYKESWALKNWCFWTVVLDKTLESPLDCKEIQPVCPKGHQPWKFIGKTEAEAETPIVWPPDVKNWLIGKDPDAGKDWKQEKGTTEDEMVGWHHWLDGHEFEQSPGVDDGQGSMACCSPWGRKESDTTEWLNYYINICLLTGLYLKLEHEFHKGRDQICLFIMLQCLAHSKYIFNKCLINEGVAKNRATLTGSDRQVCLPTPR